MTADDRKDGSRRVRQRNEETATDGVHEDERLVRWSKARSTVKVEDGDVRGRRRKARPTAEPKANGAHKLESGEAAGFLSEERGRGRQMCWTVAVWKSVLAEGMDEDGGTWYTTGNVREEIRQVTYLCLLELNTCPISPGREGTLQNSNLKHGIPQE